MRTAGALKALRALRALHPYALSALSALSAFSALSCTDDVVAPARGALAVTISGLPGGQAASVTVTGPGSFTRAVTATTTIGDLEPGTYTIAAADVTATEGRWSPTPVSQSVTVSAGPGVSTAAVAYSLVTARLAVNITGLPTGASASVTVTGPGGFSQALTATTTLNMLTPGSYTITAGNVSSGGITFHPTPPTQTVQLATSTTPTTATVAYAAETGALTVTINGLSGGVNAAVRVTGPSGYDQQLTATQTLAPLGPGTYTVTASTVGSNLTTHNPTPATQNATVTAGATTTATVTYGSSPLTLGVQLVAQGFTQPVYLTAPANDARLFIVDQPGQIRIFKDGTLLPTPFLDIRGLVRWGGEEGLLSLAFDPGYSTNGRFYVYYTDLNGDIAVARYTATPTADVADAGSRTSVITIPHPVQGNHNGGLALFGPDGMLYLATGDGGSSGDPPNNAQNVNSLLGKLLRLNVSNLPYTIPAGNPFIGTNGADEIWAYGLRNPWRYAFDGAAGTLYIADVGQSRWEEVNAVSAATGGVNYGWRRMEGTHCYPPDASEACDKTGLTLPVLEYATRVEGTCSITGGFVYRGTAIPELNGHYLYSDYCAGFLRSFRLSVGQPVDQRTWSISFIGSIFSFGVDAAGEVYMLSAHGSVYRIVRP